MTTTTHGTSRTTRLLALMTQGDDAFNACDFAAADQVHHPDMVAYITGLAKPVYGRGARRSDAADAGRDPADRKGVRPGARPDHQWDGDQLIVISAFWDAALQRKQIGLAHPASHGGSLRRKKSPPPI